MRAGDHCATDRADRHALARVLAGEGRNALARIELVASELARLDDNPIHRTRIDAIRSAAAELESVLGKIDLVSRPPAVSDETTRRCDLAAVVRDAFARLGPSLGARGVRLEVRSSCDTGSPIASPLPASRLSGLCSDLARLVLTETRGDGEWIVHVERSETGALLAIESPHPPGRDPIVPDRFARLELDVLLSECRGGLRVHADEAAVTWVVSLPEASADGAD